MQAKVYQGTITPGLCQSGGLLFQPQDAEEAVFIQKQLFKLGCIWDQGQQVLYVDGCVRTGMVVIKGQIYWNPNPGSWEYLCNSSQFSEPYRPEPPQPPAPPPMSVAELFDKLSARLDRIDQRLDLIDKRLDGLETQIGPGDRAIDKPRLPAIRRPFA